MQSNLAFRRTAVKTPFAFHTGTIPPDRSAHYSEADAAAFVFTLPFPFRFLLALIRKRR
jgi:hypothetical protein